MCVSLARVGVEVDATPAAKVGLGCGVGVHVFVEFDVANGTTVSTRVVVRHPPFFRVCRSSVLCFPHSVRVAHARPGNDARALAHCGLQALTA